MSRSSLEALVGAPKLTERVFHKSELFQIEDAVSQLQQNKLLNGANALDSLDSFVMLLEKFLDTRREYAPLYVLNDKNNIN